MRKIVIGTLCATFAAAILPSFAGAAALFTPPASCETFLTVQSRECAVSHLYRCDADKDGEVWEASFDDEGALSVVQYSKDYIWLDSHFFWDSSHEEFLPPAEDLPDMAALAADGIDTFRFTVHRTAPGEDRLLTVVGADILTGETTVIDGVTLARVNIELQILGDGNVVEYESKGTQFLDVERVLFFSGPETVFEEDGTETQYDGTPVDLINPGEAGFASTVPLYECNEQKAGFTPAPATPMMSEPKETNHDDL